MELHNMEKLETHLFSSGSRGFLLTRVVVPKYTENGAPSSGIFKDEFKSLDPPNAILCQPRPPYGVVVASPPHGGWKEELSKKKSLV
ncbi:hypothetical protein V8C40DRAFT_79070 [Trichoderma camerunense]